MKALITGASSGMGRDMAKILSQKGYDLILVARDEKKLEEVKKQLKTETKIVVMDISNEENCKKIYEENKDIDILINNAGFGDCGHFEETSLDKDIQMIHTNIIAYHILTKLYLKEMIKKDSGKILNVASIAGFMPGPLMTTYYSTKNNTLLNMNLQILLQQVITQAAAPEVQAAPEKMNLWQMTTYGGPIMIILAIMLALAVYIFIERFF